MSKHVTYHLNFRSPLHLGRRGVGLEATEISIPADTLFSAICQTWRTFYGEEISPIFWLSTKRVNRFC